jgi:hypothetical protein
MPVTAALRQFRKPPDKTDNAVTPSLSSDQPAMVKV